MIIGANKNLVIENIKKNAEQGKFNNKVEVDDPNLSARQKHKIIRHYLHTRKTLSYRFFGFIARIIIDIVSGKENKTTEVVGLENVKDIKGGAFITSNHFNPLDSTVIRTFVKKHSRRKYFIVSQESNLAMKGFIGFIMRHAGVIPITSDKNYLEKVFPKLLKEKIRKKQFVLIYPEQEMWFNYRKPRPPKRGTYYYAAKMNVPVISCFTEIVDLPEKETEEFYKTKCILHVLKPIYPDPNLSVRENSIAMMNLDYEQKKEAYEQAYGKPLTYDFEPADIAGWVEAY